MLRRILAGVLLATGINAAEAQQAPLQIRAAGGTADTLDMPAEGVRGNSHMIMMDSNSDDVAARIQRWMESKGLMR